MTFTHELHYRAGIESVMAMLVDAAFHEQLAARMHAVRSSLSVTRDGEVLHIEVERSLPAEVPDFVRPMVGSEIEVVQQERWAPAGPSGPHAHRNADVAIVIPGKPVRFEGTTRLVATDDGCTQAFSGGITVRVPVIGRRVAEQVARALRYGMDAQQDAGNDWLSRSSGT